MSNTEEVIDCHYCEHAGCENPTGWCQCYNDDGYFSHNIKDSEKEAKDCEFFEFCDIFPKT